MSGPDPRTADPRTAELADRLAAVEQRIEAACRAAGRSREEVTLVVVTKFFPAEDLARLVDLGVTEVGENKAQEAHAKLADLPPQVRDRLTVHFIGQLQTNKARLVAGFADVVHTVDRPRVAHALDRAAADRGRPLDVLIQVNLDEPDEPAQPDEPDEPAQPRAAAPGGRSGPGPSRGGERPDGIRALAQEVSACPHLTLRGLMAVAPLGADPDPAFVRLAGLAADLRREHPAATLVSAGMSGDLEAAVAHGATHLRVGSAILGPRPGPR
ncbi:YggS family pyridoxal phosphate enzyme [Arsenicicoccus sp. oral taxon 190]|uniref:YggS family pyridoxal phosphate enzyme n=1 Tax=Arsenicicoccus sp. oral taxon 190 TaxID=1658671 RepID=UPI00067A38F7|nr:YggS family pyridoxal phosphate enzyme [Arsenicicoccus sp. oral taxon 190]AKT51642.1 hypothetical protein ADJ73_10695 [Arsenicicoccus sp. oral taxon 190]